MARLRVLALALLLTVTVAACGSSPSTSPSAAASATEEATPLPTEQASSTGAALPSLDLPSDDAGLEELIPDEVGGVALTKASMKGDSFLDDAPDGGAAARAFFEGIGVNPSDVSVAFGFSTSVFVQIFRAPGAEADELVQGFKDATDEDNDTPLEWSAANVGGKDVETAEDPDSEQTLYLYGVGDLVVVVGGDEASAGEILSGMP